jgi:hypothetical protein
MENKNLSLFDFNDKLFSFEKSFFFNFILIFF